MLFLSFGPIHFVRLRPEFAAHMRQLEEIVSDLQRTHDRARHALESLLGHYPGLAADTVSE